MRAGAKGAIVVVGATASRRGVAGTAAFAPAKMAQKGLAESMARGLGPAGIHVALIVVDGIVFSPVVSGALSRSPRRRLHRPLGRRRHRSRPCAQDRSAWSFEVEARPYAEKW